MPSVTGKLDLDAVRAAVRADLALLLTESAPPGRLLVVERSGAANNIPDEILVPRGSMLARVLRRAHPGRLARLSLRSATSGGSRPLGPVLVVPCGGPAGGFVLLARRLPADPFDDGDLDRLREAAGEATPDGLVVGDTTFREAFETAAAGMGLVDTSLRYLWVNRPLCEMLGRSRPELLRLAAIDTVHPDHVDRAVTFFQRIRRGDIEAARERFRFLRPDGTALWADVGGSVVNVADPPLILVQQSDVTVEQMLTDDLVHRAMHDELTQLANRTLLRDRLQALLSRSARGGTRSVVFYLDLNDFKLVNDTYGHIAGDVVLVEIARRLAAVVRGADTVARVGGDEFIVAGEADGVDESSHLAQRIGGALGPRVDIGGRRISVMASIGVALSHPADTPESLVARADDALMKAKRARALHVVADAGT